MKEFWLMPRIIGGPRKSIDFKRSNITPITRECFGFKISSTDRTLYSLSTLGDFCRLGKCREKFGGIGKSHWVYAVIDSRAINEALAKFAQGFGAVRYK